MIFTLSNTSTFSTTVVSFSYEPVVIGVNESFD